MPDFTLQYPLSLGVHDQYAAAQKVVDYLSDEQFPVENIAIVGTELRQVERVTGRLTWSRVLAGGAGSGAWLGLLIGLILSLFTEGTSTWTTIAGGIGFGIVFGVVSASLGYAATRGQRDFSSVQSVIATKYEVMVEHKFLAQGQELLARMPGAGPDGGPLESR